MFTLLVMVLFGTSGTASDDFVAALEHVLKA
jgi:hypothetical protein